MMRENGFNGNGGVIVSSGPNCQPFGGVGSRNPPLEGVGSIQWRDTWDLVLKWCPQHWMTSTRNPSILDQVYCSSLCYYALDVGGVFVYQFSGPRLKTFDRWILKLYQSFQESHGKSSKALGTKAASIAGAYHEGECRAPQCFWNKWELGIESRLLWGFSQFDSHLQRMKLFGGWILHISQQDLPILIKFSLP